MKNLSDKDLLSIARGLTPESKSDQEQLEIAKMKSKWLEIPTDNSRKKTIEMRNGKRRKARRMIFTVVKRMRRGHDLAIEHMAVKSIYDSQLDPNLGLTWLGFTFSWDLHPSDHTKVVRKEEWSKEGGRYDEFGAMDPTAFTEQEIS